MKKYSVVLLIAVLALSSVFAGISGYVDAKYKVDFDKGTFKYTKPQDKMKASIVFADEIGKKTGEGKVYIDAAASFHWNADEKDNADTSRYGINELGFFKLNLDKLMIVGQDWTLNLKEAEKLGGYAASTLDFHTWYRHDHLKGFKGANGVKMPKKDSTSWYLTSWTNAGEVVEVVTDTDGMKANTATSWQGVTVKDDYADYQKKVAYSVQDAYEFYNDDDEDSGMNGMTFTFKGYKAAFAFNGFVGEWDDHHKEGKDSQNYYFAVETPEYNPAEGLTMQVAAGVSYRDSNLQTSGTSYQTKHDDMWTLGASVKAAYKTDKVSVDFATDHVLNAWGAHTTPEKDPVYAGAYMVKGQFAPVSAEIFFSNEAVSNKGDDKSYKLFGGTYNVNSVDGKGNVAGTSGNHDFIGKDKKYYFSSQGLYKKNIIRDLFSFQVAFDLGKLIEDVPVEFKFQGLDMLHETRIFNVFANTKLMDGDLKISVYAKDLLASFDKINAKDNGYTRTATGTDLGAWAYWDENGSKQKIGLDASLAVNEALTAKAGAYVKAGDKKFGASAGATYVADMFVADATLDSEFDYNDENTESSKMQLIMSVSSNKLVDGALLSLKYETGNILGTKNGNYDWHIGEQAGALTAKCRVNF